MTRNNNHYFKIPAFAGMTDKEGAGSQPELTPFGYGAGMTAQDAWDFSSRQKPRDVEMTSKGKA
jgi:hypothetical protein